MDKLLCQQAKRTCKSPNSFLNMYYIPGTVISTLCILINISFMPPYQVSTISIPIVQMKKQNLSNVTQLLRGQSQDSNPNSLAPELVLFTTISYCLHLLQLFLIFCGKYTWLYKNNWKIICINYFIQLIHAKCLENNNFKAKSKNRSK